MQQSTTTFFFQAVSPAAETVKILGTRRRQKHLPRCARRVLVLSLVFVSFALLPVHLPAAEKLEVELDVSEVPHLKEWGEKGRALIMEWHPRITHLLASKDFQPPQKVTLRIQKSDKGVGFTTGTKITVSSSWIEKHPDDLGLVFHELVHVVQSYPNGKPWWITEGIADYLRWAIYEGKPQSWFPRPKEKQAYRKGYRVTAGFLLWLESDKAPGLVKRINARMRQGKFSLDVFQDLTGKTIDELWAEYAGIDA